MNLKYNQIAAGLIIGLLLGTLLGASPLRWKIRSLWDHRTPQERILGRISSRLDLSSEQKTKVAAILEAKRVKIDALFAEGRSKFQAVRMETRAEIRNILTPEQIKKFEVLEAEMDARFNRQKRRHF